MGLPGKNRSKAYIPPGVSSFRIGNWPNVHITQLILPIFHMDFSSE